MTTKMQPPPRLFAHPGFLCFWSGRVMSNLAAQIRTVAVGWAMYDLTRSTWQLGLVGLVAFLPMLVCTLPAGHVADRYHRGRVTVVAQCVPALAAAILALASAGGRLTPGLIYAVVALSGCSRAFQQPAMSAMLFGLVPPALFPRATALSASAQEAATVAGPALGGLLYGFGATAPFALAAVLSTLAAACFAGLRVAPREAGQAPPGWNTVLHGLGYIARHKTVLGVVSLDLFAVLLGGATAMLPVYARDILHAGPVALGLLRGAPAAGALCMSVWLSRYPLRRFVGMRMFGAVGLFGLATCVFALSRRLPVSLGALAVLGAADVVSVVIRQTLVQMRTPDAMRGRVAAVNFLFIGTSNELGEFESGATASLIGVAPAVALGGLGSILVALLWMRLFPGLRRLDRFDDPEEAA